MSAMASELPGVSIVSSFVCSGTDQRKHQSSASLVFVRVIHRSPVTGEFPAQKASNAEMYPFDDVFMYCLHCFTIRLPYVEQAIIRVLVMPCGIHEIFIGICFGEFSNSIKRRELYLQPHVKSQPAIVPEHMGIQCIWYITGFDSDRQTQHSVHILEMWNRLTNCEKE